MAVTDKHRLFIERLKICMAMKGVSQSKLAEMAGISQATVSQWARDASAPQVDTVERVAVALGVNPGWLAYGDGDPA